MSAGDDAQVGRILDRREVLTLLGGAGAALLAGCTSPRTNRADTSASRTGESPASATIRPAGETPPGAASGGATATDAPLQGALTTAPACVVRPEQTEGPFFVDGRLNRSDIRSDPSGGSARAGVPLRLTFRVSSVRRGSCTALPGALVDVWHCDASGEYSDVEGTRGKKFLRGFQTTTPDGAATFTTIYPGWYGGRAVHVHFKIRLADLEFTSQLYFDDALTDAVHSKAPYDARVRRDTRNSADGIHRSGGDKLTLVVEPRGDGYASTFDIGVLA